MHKECVLGNTIQNQNHAQESDMHRENGGNGNKESKKCNAKEALRASGARAHWRAAITKSGEEEDSENVTSKVE